MDPIIWEREPPELRSPVLVASFSGWNDAASAAGTALGAIGASLETELVARIDPEEFFDFQANRPTIEISGGDDAGRRVARQPDRRREGRGTPSGTCC